MDFIRYFFIDTKAWVGLIIAGMGLLFLLGALKKKDWMFNNKRKESYNGVNNLLNIFSPKGGRLFILIGGVILMILGCAWCVLYITAMFKG